VDTGDEVIQMTDEVEFERSRGPNTKFVMRVVLTEKEKFEDTRKKMEFNTYRCPRCKKETKVERRSTSASIDWYVFPVDDYDLSHCLLNTLLSANDCGARFQATNASWSETMNKDTDQDIGLWLIRNIHVKQLVRLA